jgi:hypothetical protein
MSQTLTVTYVPRITRERYEQGADYGRVLRQVLFRHEGIDVCWCGAISHWSGWAGLVQNKATLSVYGVLPRLPDLGVDLLVGGRLSLDRLRQVRSRIELYLNVKVSDADLRAVLFRKPAPKQTVVYAYSKN